MTGVQTCALPISLQETVLGLLTVGDTVNIEVDIIGKYVEKLLAGQTSQPGSRLDAAFLAEHGFF